MNHSRQIFWGLEHSVFAKCYTTARRELMNLDSLYLRVSSLQAMEPIGGWISPLLFAQGFYSQLPSCSQQSHDYQRHKFSSLDFPGILGVLMQTEHMRAWLGISIWSRCILRICSILPFLYTFSINHILFLCCSWLESHSWTIYICWLLKPNGISY